MQKSKLFFVIFASTAKRTSMNCWRAIQLSTRQKVLFTSSFDASAKSIQLLFPLIQAHTRTTWIKRNSQNITNLPCSSVSLGQWNAGVSCLPCLNENEFLQWAFLPKTRPPRIWSRLLCPCLLRCACARRKPSMTTTRTWTRKAMFTDSWWTFGA